jgi:opacity protein-like surface antigen
MRLAFAALLAAALLAPAAASAQPVSTPSGGGGPPVWLRVHLGASLPQHSDLDGVDPGYDLGGTLGAWFTPVIGVEGGVGYLRSTGTSGGLERTVSDLPFSASLRLRAPGKVVELSAIAGVAIHFASLRVRGTTAGAQEGSDDSMAFGAQVGVAVDFHLTPTMLVGFDVQRSFVEPKFEGTGVRLDALRIAAALTHQF